jgi:MYXO-CTERM domain-containing protein
VRKDGAMGGSVPSLLSALDALEADGTDSDHDGVPDIAELKAGTDPNVPQTASGMPEAPVDEVPLPETGCSLSTARSPGGWLLLLGAVAAFAGRRRRGADRR